MRGLSLPQSGSVRRLLHFAGNQAKRAEGGSIVLMADKDAQYKKHGFCHVLPALTRWLAIEDVASVTVPERDLSDCFLVKPFGDMK